jgi:site-specific DNA-methyltransferase (adenine-specific)
MREVWRVLKPGAHGLVWAIPRRSHWTALALEDAGFEIRDCICHYFLSGFPKRLNVWKATTAQFKTGGSSPKHLRKTRLGMDYQPTGQVDYRKGRMFSSEIESDNTLTELITEAKEWEGWGTHLKPAIEHWWLVRKPLSEKTVAANVLKWGTGALNIDASRIPLHSYKMDRQSYFESWEARHETDFYTSMSKKARPKGYPKVAAGGWDTSYKSKTQFPEGATSAEGIGKGYNGKPRPADLHPDSRYPSHFIVGDWELLGDHCGFFHPPIYSPKARRCRGEGNHHPTVKPVELMKYFITLLARREGHVLDCSARSFSTGVAAQQLGCVFTDIEMDAKYVQIGMGRLSA